MDERLIIGNEMARSADLREEHVAQVRRFDRLCERRINEQQARALIHEVSWAQMLVLEQLDAVQGSRSAAWLIGYIDLDSGYLCRVLKDLCALGLARSVPHESDGRMREYELTRQGKRLAPCIEEFHRQEALFMLDMLPKRERGRLVNAMRTVEDVLTHQTFPQFSQPWSSPLRKRARYRPRR